MRTATLIKTDFRNIFRDPSLVMMFIAPVFILFILRFVPPIYEEYFPEAYAYRPLILALFSLVVTALSSFLLAFVMLDEKDQQLFQVFMVTPFTFPRLILIRTISMLIMGFVMNLLLIYGSGLIRMNVAQAILFSLLCSLSGPANTLLIVSIAKNKIEGATYFKMLNMFIMAPLAGVFIAGPLKYLLGIIPYFWIFNSAMEYDNPTAFYLNICIGIISHLIYLAITFYIFIRKNS